jgi:hypothetical protein
MRRRRFKQILTLEERLAEEAKRLREEAKKLPPGPTREGLLRKAREGEMVARMAGWIMSPGLQPPKPPPGNESLLCNFCYSSGVE